MDKALAGVCGMATAADRLKALFLWYTMPGRSQRKL